MIGSIISAGASLLGGLMNRSSAKDAQNAAAAQAQANYEHQKEFAQQGLRWKVEDAKAAGIHPVYAMGAPTTSFSPISLESKADTSMGNAIASMGQDIGGAINKTRTAPERASAYTQAAQALSLEKGALENEVLRSQLARIKQTNSPPFPQTSAIKADDPAPFAVPEGSKSEDRPPLMIFGKRWMTNPNTSPMKAWEDQYGDDGIASWVLPPVLATNDLGYNIYRRVQAGQGRKSWLPSQRALAYPSRGY